MQEETETVEQTETESQQAQGITESQATDSQIVEGSESTAEVAVSEESPEELKKKLAQAQMELNQKRNALAEIEKQKEEARKAELSEVERLREELAQAEEEKAQREALDLRNQFIDEYSDEKTKAAAKKLIAENPGNLSWGEVSTEEEAKAAIHRQMDAIKAVIGADSQGQDDDYTVHPNNPAATIGERQLENLSAAEMREVLPKADPR